MLINPSPVALPATRGRGQTAGRAGNTAQPCQPHTRLAPQPQHSQPTGTRAAPARQIGATTSPSLSHRPAAAWPQQTPGLHHHTQLLTVPQRGPEQHDGGASPLLGRVQRALPPLLHGLCLPCASCPPNAPVTMETSPR